MGNEPMALLNKTALSAINEVLVPTKETNPIQTAYDNQMDVYPEASATRIVSLATGFLMLFNNKIQIWYLKSLQINSSLLLVLV